MTPFPPIHCVTQVHSCANSPPTSQVSTSSMYGLWFWGCGLPIPNHSWAVCHLLLYLDPVLLQRWGEWVQEAACSFAQDGGFSNPSATNKDGKQYQQQVCRDCSKERQIPPRSTVWSPTWSSFLRFENMVVWSLITGAMEFMFISSENHSLGLGGILPFEFPDL